MIYFDAGATTLQKPPEVYRASYEAMRRFASPGRGGYDAAMQAAEAIFACRETAASLFEAEAEQVVFTMNATHALNLAIKSLVSRGDSVVISGFEHNAVTRPLYHIGCEVETAGTRLFCPEDTLAAFEEKITRSTKAVICTHVSNVFGYILPVEQIAELCRRRGVPFVLDASQSAGVLPISLKKLGAAFIAMPGHKALYGPQGTGILLCGRMPKSLMEGGSGSLSELPDMPDFLPDGAEAGTQNVPGICALAAGMRFVKSVGEDAVARHERNLRRKLEQELSALPRVRLFSEDRAQLGTLSFLIEAEDCELTAARLGRHGAAVRAGLHCAPLAHRTAGTIATGTVRVSFSYFNTGEEIERFVSILKKEN